MAPPDEKGERTRRYNNQKITEKGGEDGGDGRDDDDDDEDNDDDDDEATERPWLWWWRVASIGNGSGSGDERMLRYDNMAPPLNSYVASVCMCS